MSKIRIETKLYKGKPVIGFYPEGRDFPAVSFGVGKAKIILDHIEVIREFVAANKVAETAPPTDGSAS